MSSFNQPRPVTGLVAAADLSEKLHCAVKLDASGDVVLCGAGELGIGFLMNEPELGDACEVASFGGGALGISAATLAAGVALAADASGHLVAAVTDDYVIALSMKASVDNDVFEVMPVSPSILV